MMKTNQQLYWVLLGLALLIGAWLRLDQISYQVLVDDEWHAPHQITYYSLGRIMLTFGHADYSIPLTAYYWSLAQTIGLTEMSMRWPMLIAGISLVVALPLMLRRELGDRVSVVLALLLATAPFLILYSRIARPYALTLTLSIVALWCLDRAVRNRALSGVHGWGYSLLTGLVVWAHPVTAPLLLTPILLLWLQNLQDRASLQPGPLELGPLFSMSVRTGLLVALAILPPLINDLGALSGKSGLDSPTLDTWGGVLHYWFGTSSFVWVAGGVVLALLGLPTALKQSRLLRWLAIGLVATYIIILITRPWWVHAPVALGRYLLAALPLVLAATAVGFVQLAEMIGRTIQDRIPEGGLLAAVALVAAALWWPTTPHPAELKRPNSYYPHAHFMADLRPGRNPIPPLHQSLTTSSIWSRLAADSAESKRVAVTPFFYPTPQWLGPIWEQTSKRRVIPAYLWGTCDATRHGETPPDARFRFRNAVRVADRAGMQAAGIEHLVFYRNPYVPENEPGLPRCEAWLKQHWGPPSFEDATVAVWRVAPASR